MLKMVLPSSAALSARNARKQHGVYKFAFVPKARRRRIEARGVMGAADKEWSVASL